MRAQEGLLHHNVAPRSQKRPELAMAPRPQFFFWTGQKTLQITSKVSHSALAGDPKDGSLANNYFIFNKWALVKLVGLKRVFPDQKVAPWPQKSSTMSPKMSCSGLSGDPTAVTSVANPYIFNKWPKVKLWGLKRGLLHHKVTPRPQNYLDWPKTHRIKITPKIAHSALSWDTTAVTSATDHSIFTKCP